MARIRKSVSRWPIIKRSPPADVQALVGEGQTLVMTEKDAVKCRAFAEDNWWFLPVDARLSGEQPDKLLQHITSLVR